MTGSSTGYWLMKSEPESYSIDRLKKDKRTLWTGVRNYQARNFMMSAMKPRDRFFFYHSNAEPTGIVGVGRISKSNLPDPTALDKKSDYFDPKAAPDHPIWFCAEVEYESHLKNTVTLEMIKKTPALKDMLVIKRGQRLSIQPVTEAEFEAVLKLSGGSK
jgi:predicted RNA-binding protein with PUA-like domain